MKAKATKSASPATPPTTPPTTVPVGGVPSSSEAPEDADVDEEEGVARMEVPEEPSPPPMPNVGDGDDESESESDDVEDAPAEEVVALLEPEVKPESELEGELEAVPLIKSAENEVERDVTSDESDGGTVELPDDVELVTVEFERVDELDNRDEGEEVREEMVELKVELREGKDEEGDKVGGRDKFGGKDNVGTIVATLVVSAGGMEEVIAVKDASEGLAAGGAVSEVAETGSSVAGPAGSEVSDTTLTLGAMVDPVSASTTLVWGSEAKVCVSMIAPEPSMTWTIEMVCTTSVMVGSPGSRSAVSFSSWRRWNWACERMWLRLRPCK